MNEWAHLEIMFDALDASSRVCIASTVMAIGKALASLERVRNSIGKPSHGQALTISDGPKVPNRESISEAVIEDSIKRF
jgi:hypothetical protein